MGFTWQAMPKEPFANKIGVNFEIFRRDSGIAASK
jgi:hypothetical protein